MSETLNDDDLHERWVKSVMKAITGLSEKFAANGLTPEACIEGAVKAGVVVMLAQGATVEDAAAVLEDFAAGLRSPAPPTLSVV